MYICIACRKELKCLKNGVGIDYGGFHVYPSDTFVCPGCGIQIAATNRSAIYDKDYKSQETYIKMEE
jgi:DNA-directed RNA polymerase subunit RPC12/RpoP